MSTDQPSSAAVFVAKTVDGILYAVITAGLASLVGLAISALFADPLVILKYLLFVGGFVQIGVSVAQLWPSDPSDSVESTPRDASRLQTAVERFTPARQLGLPAGRHFTLSTRRFLSGVAILLVSFGLEAVFGV